jgi:hypothetical protein
VGLQAAAVVREPHAGGGSGLPMPRRRTAGVADMAAHGAITE